MTPSLADLVVLSNTTVAVSGVPVRLLDADVDNCSERLVTGGVAVLVPPPIVFPPRPSAARALPAALHPVVATALEGELKGRLAEVEPRVVMANST